ncbi:hypothetical protein PUN28_002794 [Cardiocondyla obscurior]|uniref:Uncharacterized protein n=1 Tax=Cardiocondyla obscurior TaxID=286306 RepID=A0AAW2GW28_9HYME
MKVNATQAERNVRIYMHVHDLRLPSVLTVSFLRWDLRVAAEGTGRRGEFASPESATWVAATPCDRTVRAIIFGRRKLNLIKIAIIIFRLMNFVITRNISFVTIPKFIFLLFDRLCHGKI